MAHACNSHGQRSALELFVHLYRIWPNLHTSSRPRDTYNHHVPSGRIHFRLPGPAMGHSSRRQNPVAAYLTVLSNVVYIGVSAATAGTLRLMHNTAAAASELTIEPLNSLVQNTTKAYFAPQISYPERPWSGMVESLSSRKRAWTMSDTSSKRTLEGRRDSLQQREEEARGKARRGSVASQNGRMVMPQRTGESGSSRAIFAYTD